MKTILVSLLIIVTSIGSLAQEKASKIAIEKAIQLVELKDGTNIYDDLSKSRLKEATDDDQEEFYNKIQTLIEKRKECNINYFSKKFTQKEITNICNELADARLIAHSQRTISFIMEWRSLKRKLYEEYTKIYSSYH